MNIKVNLSFTPDHARELLELVERAAESPSALPIDHVLFYYLKTQLIDAGVVPEDNLFHVEQPAPTPERVASWPWTLELTKASQYLPIEGDSLHTGD